MNKEKALALLDVRSKLSALCHDVPEHVFLQDGNQQLAFVEWLKAYARRVDELIAPHDEIKVSSRDIITNGKRFQNSQKVVDFAEEHKLVLPHNQHWWHINPNNRQARISGFDGSGQDATVGTPTITNGIDVYLLKADGTLFKGHRDWLVWLRKPRQSGAKQTSQVIPTDSQKSLTAKEIETATKLVKIGDLSLLAERYESILHKPFEVKLTGELDADVQAVGEAVAEYLDALQNNL